MFVFYGLCSIFMIFVFTKLYIFLYKYVKNWRVLHKIPSPPEQYILGHIYILLTSTPNVLFPRLRKFSKTYGPIYRFSSPISHIVNFLDPDDIEIILSTTKHLSKSKIYHFFTNWLGNGLLTSTGEKWHKRRKILTPAFHFTILNEFLNVFNEETSKLVQKLEQTLENENIIDVVPPITEFTLQSIAETAMGLANISEISKKTYKNAIFRITEILMKRLFTPLFRIDLIYNFSKLAKKEQKVVQILHDFSTNIIKQREQNISFTSSLAEYSKKKRLAMLDLLLAAKHEGVDIDFEGIREEVDTFMFEGHDTSAMAISYMLLTLSNLNDIQERILEEILLVLGPTKTPTYNDLQELKYTERCIKETLRLFPSVPLISRYASEDFTTNTGYFIPKGTVMHVHIFDLHRDEKLYPEPTKFDPDRFLSENMKNRHPFAYIPFSAGARNCIGQKFALLEIKSVLCGLLRRFKLEKIDDMDEVTFKADILLRSTKAVKVKIIPRTYDHQK